MTLLKRSELNAFDESRAIASGSCSSILSWFYSDQEPVKYFAVPRHISEHSLRPKQPPSARDCITAISQDGYGAFIVPIVDHTREKVQIPALRKGSEEIASYIRATMGLRALRSAGLIEGVPQ